MIEAFHVEVEVQQKNHHGERICGDVFLSKRLADERRLVAVLSDGMGHGVKANILATLTSTMALNFTREHKDFKRTAEIIMNTLPVCSERKISYSTFTIMDIEAINKISILEYDNPTAIIIRDKRVYDPGWTTMELNSKNNAGKELKSCSFDIKKGDRVIVCSDGVAQSGLGSDKYPFGWGRDGIADYALQLLSRETNLSAQQLSTRILNKAVQNDGFMSKDDTSVVTFYFREPRRLLICTGPPYDETNDKVLAEKVRDFDGSKIACGATTSDILARELGRDIRDSFEFTDPDLPPISYMDGLDLITEGILTLTKVHDILKKMNSNTRLGKGPADEIVKLIRDSDQIHFIIGTRINIAHQDPNLPIELEIRRTVVKRIARVLEEKYLKDVLTEFI